MTRLLSIVFVVAILSGSDAGAQEIVKWKLNDLEQAIKKTGRPTIFNFWATTCKPCVEEIPWFQQAVKQYDSAGVQLILVSLDLAEAYPQKIRAFAAKHGFESPVRFLDETNADLFCPVVDEGWSGAIPASLFVNNSTGYTKFFEDQVSREVLEQVIREMLGKQ